MTWVVVTPWVRAKAHVAPDERLARRSVVPSTCQPSHGRPELEGTRLQAAGWSPDRRRVVDRRRSLTAGWRGQPTGSSGRKATVPGSPRHESGTPAGSKSGACRQRGHAGTWASPRSPGQSCRAGEPADSTTLAWSWGAATGPRAGNGDHARREPARSWDARDQRSDPRRAGGPSSRRRGPGQVGT
jgi:hypothetical protein